MQIYPTYIRNAKYYTMTNNYPKTRSGNDFLKGTVTQKRYYLK